jgi:hypothetical protein
MSNPDFKYAFDPRCIQERAQIFKTRAEANAKRLQEKRCLNALFCVIAKRTQNFS